VLEEDDDFAHGGHNIVLTGSDLYFGFCVLPLILECAFEFFDENAGHFWISLGFGGLLHEHLNAKTGCLSH
jgi:hypothetical protein